MIKLKRAGLLTKIVLLLLLLFIGVSFFNLHRRIADARIEANLLDSQVQEQTQRNAELANDIENSDDPEHLKDIAREKLDLLEPGEKVFYVTPKTCAYVWAVALCVKAVKAPYSAA